MTDKEINKTTERAVYLSELGESEGTDTGESWIYARNLWMCRDAIPWDLKVALARKINEDFEVLSKMAVIIEEEIIHKSKRKVIKWKQ